MKKLFEISGDDIASSNIEKSRIKLSSDSENYQVKWSYGWTGQVRPEPMDRVWDSTTVFGVRK